MNDMADIFSEVKKVTMPGGFCCIVIADELSGGVLIPLPSLLVSKLVELDDDDGWHLRDMIIWNKVTAGRNGAGNRFGQFVRIPIPTRTQGQTTCMNTYLCCKRVRGQGCFQRIRQSAIPLNRAMKRQLALSVWDITPVPPKVVDHPAAFPEQIPWRLIQMYTKKGDVVLDPMCGSGQTVKVARNLGRSYVGVDIKKPYATLAKKRVKEDMLLSNFMIPLYFPIKWADTAQSGKKEDAHIDVEDHIPRGYEVAFQNTLTDEENGTEIRHIYYRNSLGGYLCCVIGFSQDPFIMNVGNPTRAGSPLKKNPCTPPRII